MTDYTETPEGVALYGDAGGDYQVTEAWGRQFIRDTRTVDGDHAIVTVIFYGVETDTDQVNRVKLVRQVEYRTCRDLRDQGGTETWFDYRYDDMPFDSVAAGDEHARAACESFDMAMVTWNGSPLTDTSTHPIREAEAARGKSRPSAAHMTAYFARVEASPNGENWQALDAGEYVTVDGGDPAGWFDAAEVARESGATPGSWVRILVWPAATADDPSSTRPVYRVEYQVPS